MKLFHKIPFFSGDGFPYVAIQVTEKDIWIVTYPRSGTTWTQEMVSLLFSKTKKPQSSFHPDLANSQWVGLWGREKDRHWQEVFLPWHGLAGSQGHHRKYHRLRGGFGYLSTTKHIIPKNSFWLKKIATKNSGSLLFLEIWKICHFVLAHDAHL